MECNFLQAVKGRGLCSFVQLESNGDFLLYHNRVLGVSYNYVLYLNRFSFSEEPTKEEGSESHKQSAEGINS